MKKFYILTSIAVLFLVACNEEDSVENEKEIGPTVAQVQSNSEEKSLEKENDIETIVIEANYMTYNKESDLYESAELVVVAHTVKDFNDRTHVVKYTENTEEDKGIPEAIADFYTETPIKIMKILKQPSDSTIAKNDSIIFIEPISLLEDKFGVKKITTENYLEIQKGKPYILYLKKNTYGQYGIINMNNGRFNLEGTDEVMNLDDPGREYEKANRQEMKKAIEKKFEKEIKEVLNNH